MKPNPKTPKPPTNSREETQRLNAIARIGENQFYADDELNFIISLSLPENVSFVSTAISAVPEQLKISIREFTDSTDLSLVVPLHIHDNHFVGLYIERVEDGFSIFYIDPTGNQEIPDNILQAISEVFEDPEIETSSSIIQHSQDGVATNVHCGAFTAEILVGLASGEMRIVDGRLQGRVLVGDGENAFADVEDRDEQSSDRYGKFLREKHLELLGKDVEDLSEFSKLSLVESPLPQTPSKSSIASESPDSSDAEYGAKTLMRKIQTRVSGVEVKTHKIGNTRLPEITIDQIRANPNKYYIANFRGDYLDYFPDHQHRRQYVKERVDGTQKRTPNSYKSQAVANIETKHLVGSSEYDKEVKGLKTPEKLKDTGFVKKYKSSTHFSSAVKDISPTHGNPVISTSKDTQVVPRYSDHPKTGAKLHPKYNNKKPQHRLIGMATVTVHEAGEYIDLPKADIEKLRQEKKIGGKSGVERDNQEIMFPNIIESQNVAGYVPLAYPNLSKKYSNEDKQLFGLDKLSKAPQMTRSDPKSLGDGSKTDTIYAVNQEFQWQLAEKFVQEKNPNGELLWVDNEGKFRRFRGDELEVDKTSKAKPSPSPSTSRSPSSPQSEEDLTKKLSEIDLNKKGESRK
jgi:hypothetical protein